MFWQHYALAQNKTFVYQLDYRYSDKKDDKKKETFTLDIVNQQSVFRTEDEKKSKTKEIKIPEDNSGIFSTIILI